jgi:hypothetical protein
LGIFGGKTKGFYASIVVSVGVKRVLGMASSYCIASQSIVGNCECRVAIFGQPLGITSLEPRQGQLLGKFIFKALAIL